MHIRPGLNMESFWIRIPFCARLILPGGGPEGRVLGLYGVLELMEYSQKVQ